MKKDIFIDNNIAKNFTNPMDPEYIKLILWLQKYDEKDKDNCAHLAVSKKLLGEYLRSAMNASTGTSIPVLIELLQRQGRLHSISNDRIKAFQQKYITKPIERKLVSNKADHEHIPVVLLSHRKYVLSIDDNFIRDLVGFPDFHVTAAKRPQDIAYAV